jgi:AhpD family alkylhydroperoxidase
MATVKLLSDDELSPEARAVFDDIRKVRKSDFVNNFWRALAHDPKTLRRTWESIKEVMAPGALDPRVKEMLYVAVSIAHGCSYCIHSHTAAARAKGMTEAEYAEMLAIVGMAAETNRLVTALGVPRNDGVRQPAGHGARRARRRGVSGRCGRVGCCLTPSFRGTRQREPGIHRAAELVDEWIPGSRLRRAPE